MASMSSARSSVPLYDAHCHLQDARLAPFLPQVLEDLRTLGVRRLVVNGTCEADWHRVLELAATHESIVPSLGLHPWYVKDRTANWLGTLSNLLQSKACAVGEIGLDRWIEGYDLASQERVFVEQLALATDLDRPVSIHCLKAWGRLLEILSAEQRPVAGFLLHSYGGPVEMVRKFADLGAYFSFSGYFAHPRKAKQKEVFRSVPRDRLLIETDAPDMMPPADLQEFALESEPSGPINHPGNIRLVLRYLSEFLEEESAELEMAIEINFRRLFGGSHQNVNCSNSSPV
jgi:TatD DNase family protein